MSSDLQRELTPPFITLALGYGAIGLHTLMETGIGDVPMMFVGAVIVAAIGTVLGVIGLFIAAAVLDTGYGSIPMAALKVFAIMTAMIGVLLFIPGVFLLTLIAWVILGGGLVMWLFDLDSFESGITMIIIYLTAWGAQLVGAMSIASWGN